MAKPNTLSPERHQAFTILQINPSHKAILTLDGGGMRGILTIQLIKKLEEIAGIPCYELFDMVAGTSTGAIIAGLIATGHTALQIEDLYTSLVTEVFDKRCLGDRYINPPKFSKDKYRENLHKLIGNISLQDASSKTDIDLLITSQDLSAAEETFFTCFKQMDNTYYGTYKDVLLRAAMEATMSAPTYFYPLERFVDGGTTTYNNPSLAAFIEAISYSFPKDSGYKSNYQLNEISLFSFGTGISRQFIQPNKTIHPPGIPLMFWLNWIMTATGQDASAMQVDTFRSPIINKIIDYRRFQISIDPASIKKIPDTDSLDEKKYKTKWLHELGEDVLGNIDMSDITRFDLMKVIGAQMAAFIVNSGNCFTKDLATNGKDLLVTALGDTAEIKKLLSDPKWIDDFKA